MLHDIKPGTEEQLQKEMTVAYLGIDPTADSLHIGHLVGVMLLKHFQNAGHKPIVLVGGATGMIGDPSGKSAERNLLDEPTLRHNQDCLKKQLSRLLNFADGSNAAEMVNNYDWMKEFSFLEFVRDVGKHITVNYMMAKDSVRKRLEKDGAGMSFTEFTYQLLQGYDFLHLYRDKNCKLQMGGSDQWGNITTGTELIRRIDGGDTFALTCPLITKADGTKFGKTEAGNVWLDPQLTTPYSFYQFWLNTSDVDGERYIKIFTLLSQSEIEAILQEHSQQPHLRILQKRLAKELTVMVHSEEAYNKAVEASEILFGNATTELLRSIDELTFLDVFKDVKQYTIEKEIFAEDLPLINLTVEQIPIFASKGVFRRLVSGGGVYLNQTKIQNPESIVGQQDFINSKYLLLRLGKKDYRLIIAI